MIVSQSFIKSVLLDYIWRLIVFSHIGFNCNLTERFESRDDKSILAELVSESFFGLMSSSDLLKHRCWFVI
jgi:hypothetical protein